MNLLFSCIGRRGYIAEYFRPHLRPGDRIIGTSNTKWTPGFAACDKAYVLPSIFEPGYVEAVLSLCSEERIDALISFFDQDVDILSQNLNSIRALGVVPVLPNAESSKITFDKYQTYLFLRDNGLKTAKTWIDCEQAIRELAGRDYPVFVKPRRGFASIDLFTATSPKEVRILFKRSSEMIVQERLNGTEYGLDILNDLHGNVIEVVPRKKLAMRAGETDQAISVKNKMMMSVGKHLGEKLGHAGPLDVDIFLYDDEISILELNPRFGGGYPVSQLAGADFPGLIVNMLRNEEVNSQIGSFKDGVVMMKEYRVAGGWLQDDDAAFLKGHQ